MITDNIKIILDKFGGKGYLIIKEIPSNKKKVEIEVIDTKGKEETIIPSTQVKKEWYKVESARKKILAEVGIIDKEQIIQLVKHIDNKYKDKIEKEKTKTIKEENTYDIATKEKAMKLLKDPAWFYNIGKLFEKGMFIKKINKKRWVLGEEYKKRLLPTLLFESRIGKINNTTLAGTPATAKDVLARMSIELTNIKAIERSRLTSGAMEQSDYIKNCELIYLREDENVYGEKGRQRRGMRGDDGGLDTERLIKNAETEEYISELNSITGKSFLTTTNDLNKERALASDTIYLEMDDSEELNKRVIQNKLASREEGKVVTSNEEIKIWQCAFDILVENYDNREIKIPSFTKLFSLFNTKLSDYRRMPEIIGDLIDSVVIQRMFQKPKNKRYEADITDLFIALRIGDELFKRVRTGITDNQIKILKAMNDIDNIVIDELTTSEIVNLTELSQPIVSMECNNLEKSGFLTKKSGGKGRGHENKFILTKNALENIKMDSLYIEPVELEKKVRDVLENKMKINLKNVFIYLFFNYSKNVLENKPQVEHNNNCKFFSDNNIHTLIDPITGIDISTCFNEEGEFIEYNGKEDIYTRMEIKKIIYTYFRFILYFILNDEEAIKSLKLSEEIKAKDFIFSKPRKDKINGIEPEKEIEDIVI